MEKTNEKRDFKKWLEYLQQESWQLELIISSILLVVLTTGSEVVNDWANETIIQSTHPAVAFFPFLPLLLITSIGIAKINLVVHIFLRGFWIGCIGLRYVSNEIDIESLNYSEPFTKFLKSKDLNFDRYLEQLEKVCSIIFSFTFLLIFEVFSIFCFIASVLLIGSFLSLFEFPYAKYLRRFVIFFLLFTAFLHLIDFIFLGFFKKVKWISKVYYPFYRIYNLFSFSFFYRPLYYNFIDNTLGRRYMRSIVPYIIGLILFSSGLVLGEYRYFPDKGSTSRWINEHYYDDISKGEESSYSVDISIPTMQVKENFLPVFLAQKDIKETNRVLETLCPDFKPYSRNSLRFLAFEGFAEGYNARDVARDASEHNMRADTAINCIASMYKIKVDTLLYEDLEFYFTKHSKVTAKGLLTHLDISNFEKGNHVLYIEQKVDYKDSAFVRKTFEIPFVKYN